MCPDLVQAWVSWAQFEKRVQQGCLGDHLQRCRSVLQRGLTLNPNNAKLCQVDTCAHSRQHITVLTLRAGYTRLWQAHAHMCLHTHCMQACLPPEAVLMPDAPLRVCLSSACSPNHPLPQPRSRW